MAPERDAQDTFGRLNDLIRPALGAVGSRTGEETLFSVNARMRAAFEVFLDERSRGNREAIEAAIGTLEPIRRWMHERNFVDGENDALWGLYLGYHRTDRWGNAEECLKRLRDNIARARESISDPSGRARVMARFPHLFPALCQVFDRLDATGEMLIAIEESKGRILADLQARLRNEPASDREFREAVHRLPTILTSTRAHYLTFLVAEEATYGVLLTAEGSLHRAVVPLSQEEISSYVVFRNPQSWGRCDPIDPLAAPVRGDLPRALAPLVEWLEPFVKDGVLSAGDHLCYSPDGDLHSLPLHYLDFLGKPLVHHFAVSRVHGAHSLVQLLQGAERGVERFFTVEVPGKQDDADKRAQFHAPGESLEAIWPGRGLRYRSMDFAGLRGAKFENAVVHFATHGVFVERSEDERGLNPFRSSGLILASNGEEPDLYDVARGRVQDSNLLSPERFLNLGVDVSGSHVTLQACVAGLAREGVGGEALGLEWALFQRGAQSVLSTHWNVDAESSALFTKRFYENWLLRSKSRSAAWRNVVLEFLESGGTLSDPYHWAPFSLSGDWR